MDVKFDEQELSQLEALLNEQLEEDARSNANSVFRKNPEDFSNFFSQDAQEPNTDGKELNEKMKTVNVSGTAEELSNLKKDVIQLLIGNKEKAR